MTATTMSACQAYPKGSGIYSCSGKLGLHLQVKHTIQSWLQIGEIRAYSVQPTTASQFTLTTSTQSTCSVAGENLFAWPLNGSNQAIDNIQLYTTCRQSLAGGSPAFYQVQFNPSRLVHAVTIIGLRSVTFSQNWKLYVLENGTYSLYGRWVTTLDNFGKEIPIGTQTTSIRIERDDGQELRLFWVGIFSTETDCPGTLDWSDSWTTWPVILKDPSTTTTYIARAKLGSYVLTHNLKQIDDNALPSYVSYDAATQTISVKPPANTILSLQLKATASVAYDSCFKSQRFFLTFNICTQTLTASPASLALTLEIAGQALTSPLPAVTSSLSTTLAFALDSSAPSFFKVQGSNLVIDSTAAAGTFSFGITVTDLACSATITIAAIVTLFDCHPNGFTLSKSSLQLELNSAAQTITWSQTPVNSFCGTYSVTSNAPQLIQVSGQNITVLSTPAGNYTQTLTLTRQAANQSMTATTNLQINVYDCAIAGFALTPSTVSVEFLGLSKIIDWSKNANDQLCGNYDITSVSTSPPLITVAANQRLIVQSTSLSQLPTQTVTITLKRQNSSQTATASLQIDVYCAVPHLVITQLATNTEVKVGIDVQPVRVPFKVDLPCFQPATFSVSNSPQFLQVESLTSSSGNIKIENATGAMHGVYKLQLTATAMTMTKETVPKDFSIFINGCSTSTFVHQTIPNTEVFIQSGQVTGQIRFSEFQHTLGMLGNDCGQTVYRLSLASGKPTPTWVSIDSDNKIIKYDVSSVGKASSFAFEITASLEQYPLAAISESFNITVASSEIKCNQLPPAIYRIGDRPATFAVSYSNQTFATQTKLTKVIQPVFKREGSEVPQPQFVKYSNGAFSISSMNVEDVDSYQLGLRIGYQEFPSFQVICELSLQVAYEPKFNGDQVEDHSVTCEKPWSLTLPEYTDLENKPAKLSVEFGQADSMFKFDQSSRRINSKPAQLSGKSQTFQVAMILTDSHEYSSTFTFNLKVSCRVFAETPANIQPLKQMPMLGPPKPLIAQISSYGLIRVQFSRKLVPPTYEEFPELKRKAECAENCRMLNTTANQTEAVEIVNSATVVRDGLVLPILEINVISGQYSNRTLLGFDWKCVQFTPSYMDIQLNFTQARVVSIYSERDSIALQFNGFQYFRSEDNQTFPENEISQRSIPPQVDNKLGPVLSQAAQSVAASSKAIVVLQFMLNMIVSQSLQQMFGAINKLQIMIHFLLINITIASNAFVFFASLVSFVTFDIFDTEPLSRRIFALNSDKPFSEGFSDFGYGSQFVIINLGTMFYALIAFITGLLLIPCLNKSSNSKILKGRDKLRKTLVWGSFINLFNEGYLEIALTSSIAYCHWSVRNFGEGFDKAVACAFIVVIVGAPLFGLIFLQRNRVTLNNHETEAKFGALYEGLRFKRTRWALLEPFVRDLRRLALALSLVFLRSYPTFQLMSAYFQILAVSIFVGEVEPFREKATQRMELFNEITVSVIFYHLVCFADLVTDPERRFQVGWSMIATISSCLTLNFGIILYSAAVSVIRKVKIFLHRRREAKRQKRRQKIDEERQKQLFRYYEEENKAKQEQEANQSERKLVAAKTKQSKTTLNAKRNNSVIPTQGARQEQVEEEKAIPPRKEIKLHKKVILLGNQDNVHIVSIGKSDEDPPTPRFGSTQMNAGVKGAKQQKETTMLVDCSMDIVSYPEPPKDLRRILWMGNVDQARDTVFKKNH